MRLATELGISDAVTFSGFLSEAEKEAFYARTHLCVYVPLREPLGLVPIEAGFRGIPTVASASGGPSEVVVDGVTGLLADPEDPVAIADRIAHFLERPQDLERMGNAARGHVAEAFGIAKAASFVESELTRVAQR
jgi:D-inositol-3-phosphate glycosyltransferase